MPKKNRETLRTRFSDGAMPSMTDFADLIDSMLNIVDDGIERTISNGLRLRQVKPDQSGPSNKLISFYKDVEMQSAIWSMQLNDKTESLQFYDTDKNRDLEDRIALLTLAKSRSFENGNTTSAMVGINKAEPLYTLDVEGTISSVGRIGKKGEKYALADGDWHTIRSNLSGCCAFEIMAGAGKKLSGNYAIMHAFALNAFNSKGEITYHQSHHSSKCNRIELQWAPTKTPMSDGANGEYDLEIRVGCSYYEQKKKSDSGDEKSTKSGSEKNKEQVWIKYYISELWFDREMLDSAIGPSKDEMQP